MDNAFTRALSTPVPQGEQADPRQVPNNAGGYTFTIDDKTRLERFLILGTDGGTYYVSERDLTKQSLDFLIDLIQRDPHLVLHTALDISYAGRAYRNSAAILTMAMLFKYGPNGVKSAAREVFPGIVRTSTHLFEFAKYVELLGGWGRSKRSAVADWYSTKSPDKLAYQLVKYRQRDGWTHRDLMRLSHTRVDPVLERFASRWYKDEQNAGVIIDERPELDVVRAFAVAQEQTSVNGILGLLDRDWAKNLPWEALPTQFLTEPDVWKKLFYNNQINGQALVRQITRLSRNHAFNDLAFAADYAARLVDEEMIARTRLHPINYLNALVVHTEGQVKNRGGFFYDVHRNRDWDPVPVIVDALNEGFTLAFKHVVPANKRTLIGLDVSGSMGGLCNGLDLTCAQVGAAMSMSVTRTEPMYKVMGFSHQFKDLGIAASDSLNAVLKKTSDQNFGGTDCSLPMIWALNNEREFDTFLILTDNETWAGRQHPHVALNNYRKATGINAKMVVLGMTATNISIADPSDRGMLDVCGIDSNVPKVIADFSAGRI
jgi:60 kDa SS-A/Ro ribonucleoprotein